MSTGPAARSTPPPRGTLPEEYHSSGPMEQRCRAFADDLIRAVYPHYTTPLSRLRLGRAWHLGKIHDLVIRAGYQGSLADLEARNSWLEHAFARLRPERILVRDLDWITDVDGLFLLARRGSQWGVAAPDPPEWLRDEGIETPAVVTRARLSDRAFVAGLRALVSGHGRCPPDWAARTLLTMQRTLRHNLEPFVRSLLSHPDPTCRELGLRWLERTSRPETDDTIR